VDFLKAEYKHLDFDGFFSEIEEKNKMLLTPILKEIKNALIAKKED
jgi:hypothetical protein